MDLYFIPMACSLSCRMAIYEAGADAAVTLHAVDLTSKKTADGQDFLLLNTLGKVPLLRLADGSQLTENTAILLYLADTLAPGQLAPSNGLDRYRVVSWLSYTASEMHMRAFGPLVSTTYPAESKIKALEDTRPRLSYLNQHLAHTEYLVGDFSVADAALASILNWSDFINIDLKAYPAVADYKARVFARPHVARAWQDELKAFSGG
jgi:glutathione S-transferase